MMQTLEPYPAWSCLAVALLCGSGEFADAAAPPLVENAVPVRVGLSNLSSQPLRSTSVTFGRASRQGQFPHSVRVSLLQAPVPAQVDIKRRYDDGSVRFAVISVVLEELAPRLLAG